MTSCADSQEEVIATGRDVDLEHFWYPCQLLRDEAELTLDEFECNEGLYVDADSSQIELWTVTADHPQLLEPPHALLRGIAGHPELACELHDSDSRVSSQRPDQFSVKSIDGDHVRSLSECSSAMEAGPVTCDDGRQDQIRNHSSSADLLLVVSPPTLRVSFRIVLLCQ